MTIPPRLHFCWIGTRLPWAYVFAILSAAGRSELQDIVLHHTDALEDCAERQALEREGRLRLIHLDAERYLIDTAHLLGLADQLVELYRRLDNPVSRSDLLRAAILYREGGIYLDLDTVTVASLLPLTQVKQFLGSEFIVWPEFARTSRSPIILSRHLALDLLRKLCRAAPHGWKLFRLVQRLYVHSVNNAVMGAEPRSSLLAEYLTAMARLAPGKQTQRYGLGPDLLRQVVRHHDRDGLTIHQPSVFYPLAPEVSEHWFRIVPRVLLGDVIGRETRVAHWYASVRTKTLVATITPDYVRRNRDRQLYSSLVCSNVDQLAFAA